MDVHAQLENICQCNKLSYSVSTQKKMANIKVFLSIVTTRGSDWRKNFADTKILGLRECALFPTYLNAELRKEFYSLLEKSAVKKCPFVHLRSDMTGEEIEYLMKNFGTEVFCTHTEKEYPIVHDWSRFSKSIYIENVYHSFDTEEMRKWAGACLDSAHLENDRLLEPERFAAITENLKKYPIGCNHISGSCKSLRINSEGVKRYDTHVIKDLSDFDYLKRYPKNYFSRYCALEVENSLEDQLKFRDYVAGLLDALPDTFVDR